MGWPCCGSVGWPCYRMALVRACGAVACMRMCRVRKVVLNAACVSRACVPCTLLLYDEACLWDDVRVASWHRACELQGGEKPD